MVRIGKILFPVDFSENNRLIVPYVREMLGVHGARLYLLHVVSDLSQHLILEEPVPDLGRWQDQGAQQARQELAAFAAQHFPQWPLAELEVMAGDPSLAILAVAEREGIDLIVMGTHGRRGLEHVIFGSVAERVVRSSPVPVLTVNPHRLGREAL